MEAKTRTSRATAGVTVLAAATAVVVAASSSPAARAHETAEAAGAVETRSGGGADLGYRVMGRDARIIREVGDPVETDVRGVPASPVDSFSWDGAGVDDAWGGIWIDLDPVANEGRIVARWTDGNGRWRLEQKAFAPPPHPTGLRFGPSAEQTVLTPDDPVVTDVWLHGDTGAAGPVLPTLFNHLATWGPANVTLDGEPFENPLDGPAPQWSTHVMVSEGVRGDDGTVTANDGEDVYTTDLAGAGDTDPDDLEVHLLFRDGPGPQVAGNFPPMLSFNYHVQFEDVKLRVSQRS